MAKRKADLSTVIRKYPKLVSWLLNQMGNRINKSIQDGVKTGKDIHGKPFDKLSKLTTQPIRARRGQGNKPLLITGNMKKTKKRPSTPSTLNFEIKMNAGPGKNKGRVQYGAYQNQGFDNSPKSAFPGTTVPKREWFGVSKDMKPGGKEFDKFIETFFQKVRRAIKS